MEPVMTDVAVQPAPGVVLYKIPEVMRMLRMSRGALYQEMSAGRLRRVKRGRSVFVTAAAIADYVALLERETEAAAR
jgi:predicted DNA-binding transcriptional regulator AlpA